MLTLNTDGFDETRCSRLCRHGGLVKGQRAYSRTDERRFRCGVVTELRSWRTHERRRIRVHDFYRHHAPAPLAGVDRPCEDQEMVERLVHHRLESWLDDGREDGSSHDPRSGTNRARIDDSRPPRVYLAHL